MKEAFSAIADKETGLEKFKDQIQAVWPSLKFTLEQANPRDYEVLKVQQVIDFDIDYEITHLEDEVENVIQFGDFSELSDRIDGHICEISNPNSKFKETLKEIVQNKGVNWASCQGQIEILKESMLSPNHPPFNLKVYAAPRIKIVSSQTITSRGWALHYANGTHSRSVALADAVDWDESDLSWKEISNSSLSCAIEGEMLTMECVVIMKTDLEESYGTFRSINGHPYDFDGILDRQVCAYLDKKANRKRFLAHDYDQLLKTPLFEGILKSINKEEEFGDNPIHSFFLVTQSTNKRVTNLFGQIDDHYCQSLTSPTIYRKAVVKSIISFTLISAFLLFLNREIRIPFFDIPQVLQLATMKDGIYFTITVPLIILMTFKFIQKIYSEIVSPKDPDKDGCFLMMLSSTWVLVFLATMPIEALRGVEIVANPSGIPIVWIAMFSIYLGLHLTMKNMRAEVWRIKSKMGFVETEQESEKPNPG